MRLPIQHALVTGFCCLAFACSGAQKTNLDTATSVPAAVGDVRSKVTDNGNTDLEVNVEHLAPAQKIASGASVYVVWAKPETGEPPQNLGALTVGDDRKGTLTTTTPLRQFDVFVTPEASSEVQHPSNEPVMKAKVAR